MKQMCVAQVESCGRQGVVLLSSTLLTRGGRWLPDRVQRVATSEFTSAFKLLPVSLRRRPWLTNGQANSKRGQDLLGVVPAGNWGIRAWPFTYNMGFLQWAICSGTFCWTGWDIARSLSSPLYLVLPLPFLCHRDYSPAKKFSHSEFLLSFCSPENPTCNTCFSHFCKKTI